ncbi:MAG: hypothetical protein JW915_06845, partial [Chitinispirillaceae bacterium]|nr:hypothetical protein [Chitinispirillaceae bacterium]
NGYSQIFDDIVVNWSAYSGATAGVNRLALVETRAGTVIIAGTDPIKERLSLVNRGTITTASPVNNSANRPDTDCVAFFDGYSRVFLNIDGPSYQETEKSATGIAIRIPQNVHLFTYNPINSQFTSLLDGSVNHAITVRNNSEEYNSIISNGLWCKGEGPVTADADTAFAFYIGISPVNLQHGWTSAPVVKTDADKALLTDPRGQIKSEINGIFDIQVLNDDGTINEKARFGHLMLPGQKRKCIYNDKYKMSGSTINFTIAGSATGVLDFSDKQTTYAVVEAKSICPYEAAVVRAEENGADGTIYRVFEKMCTVFNLGLNSSTGAVQNTDGTFSVNFLPLSDVLQPAQLRAGGKIRIEKPDKISILDKTSNQLLPDSEEKFNNDENLKGSTFLSLTWDEYKQYFITPGEIKLKANKSELAGFSILYQPENENSNYLAEKISTGDKGFFIYPDIDTNISADDAKVEIYAWIGSGGYYDGKLIGPETKIRWSIVSGSGGRIEPHESMVVDGLASTFFYPSTVKGSVFSVKADVVELELDGSTSTSVTGISAQTGLMTTVAGAASASTSTFGNCSRSAYPADGVSQSSVEITLRDAFGNTLPDNTYVEWYVDAGDIVSGLTDRKLNSSGVARATVTSGMFPGPQNLLVSAGAEKTFPFSNTLVTPSAIISTKSQLVIEDDEETTLTARFPGVPIGTEVKWFTTNGSIKSKTNIIDANGTSTAVLSAMDGRIGHARVGAGVGSILQITKIPFVSNCNVKLTIEKNVLAGDLTSNASLPVEYIDENTWETGNPGTRNIDVPAVSQVTVHGPAGRTIVISGIPIESTPGTPPTRPFGKYIYASGLPENGRITLPETGTYTFTVKSFGVLDPETSVIYTNSIVATLQMVTVAKKLAEINDPNTFSEDVYITTSKALKHTGNIVRGFVGWGGTDGVDVMAGDFVAGLFIWGDIRDLVKEIAVGVVPGGRDIDWAVVAFAVAGLVTELAPGLAEGLDAYFAAVKTVVKAMPPGPLRNAIVTSAITVVKIWKVSGAAAALDYIKKMTSFLNELITNFENVISSLTKVLTDNAVIQSTLKLFGKIPNPLKKIDNITRNFSETVAKKFIKSIDGINDAILKKMSDAQMDLLATHLKHFDEVPGAIKGILNSSDDVAKKIQDIANTRPTFISIFFKNEDVLECVGKIDVWKQSWNARGQLIEHALAATDYKDFKHVGRLFEAKNPTWDFVSKSGDKWISLKTVRIPQKSNWTGRVKKEIEKIYNKSVSGEKILEVRIPKGQLSNIGNEMGELNQYNNKFNIKLIFKEF